MWITFLNQGDNFVFAECEFDQLPIENLYSIIGEDVSAPIRVSLRYSIYFDTSIVEGAFFGGRTRSWNLYIVENRVAGQKL